MHIWIRSLAWWVLFRGALAFACTSSAWTTSLGANTFSFSEATTGASINGTFTRVASGFLELTVVDKAAGSSRGFSFTGSTIYASEIPGISLNIQPLIEEDLYHPVISLSAACPTANVRANFIFEHWSPDGGNDVSSRRQPVGGYFDSQGSSPVGLSVRDQYDIVDYASLGGVNLTPTPVACANGVALINSGGGDRMGRVTYAGASGLMLYQTSVCHSALAMPQYQLSDVGELAGPYVGFIYDTKQTAASTQSLSFTIHGTGCTSVDKCTGGGWSLEVTGLNKPRGGMFEATLYDGAANRGNVLCTVGRNLKNPTKTPPFRQQLACVAQKPAANAEPLTLLLTSVAQNGGALDTAAFGAGQGFVGTAFGGAASATALALGAEGKILVGGTAIENGRNVFALARYRSDGALDTGFGNSGLVTTAVGSFQDGVRAVFIQSDGHLIAAGSSATDALGTTSRFALARYTSAGALDTSFGTNGIVTTPVTAGDDSVLDGVMQTDGKLLLAGSCFNPATSALNACLTRYNPDGTLDSTFGANGTVLSTWATKVVKARSIAGRRILALGESGTQAAVARYNADGTLDTSFGTGGSATLEGTTTAVSLDARADGSLVVGGQLMVAGPPVSYQWFVARFLANGVLDTTFGTNGLATTTPGAGTAAGDTPTDLAVTIDDKIQMVGRSYNGVVYSATAVRFTGAGALDTSFNGTGTAVFSTGAATGLAELSLQPDGRWLAVGDSSAAGGSFLVLRAWP